MNWGNHQPRAGLIEAAFAKAMLERERNHVAPCHYLRSICVRLTNSKTGQEVWLPSLHVAADFLNVPIQRFTGVGAGNIRGWAVTY